MNEIEKIYSGEQLPSSSLNTKKIKYWTGQHGWCAVNYFYRKGWRTCENGPNESGKGMST